MVDHEEDLPSVEEMLANAARYEAAQAEAARIEQEAVVERLAEQGAAKPAKPARPSRPPAVSPATRRGPLSIAHRVRLSDRRYHHHRANALADEADLHPAKLARLLFRGTGISQTTLADLACVNVSQVERLERGKSVSPRTRARIARALGVEAAEIGGGERS